MGYQPSFLSIKAFEMELYQWVEGKASKAVIQVPAQALVTVELSSAKGRFTPYAFIS
jgi:hypothetical protein